MSQLLNKDPKKRTTMTNIAAHPFLTGKHTFSRLKGDRALKDIFLSYRVSSDAKNAEAVYNHLTAKGFSVWWDKVASHAFVFLLCFTINIAFVPRSIACVYA